VFAPVETKEEALSFAVALTGSFPKYDASVPEGYFPVAPPIISTYMEETNGGFKIHLFDYDICGCGSHPYYAVDYYVTRAGNVTELSRQKSTTAIALFAWIKGRASFCSVIQEDLFDIEVACSVNECGFEMIAPGMGVG
jgi:hypothetical protein